MGIMNFTKKPSKRMRLDLQNNYDVNVGNDDLWGQEDITAEEFDMLEVQATQETSGISSFRKPLPKTSKNDISLQVDTTKQQQYELEGKVKILSDSLEKVKKELMEEKLKKEKLVGEKVQEFQQKEKFLQKEIEKIQSSLQFKDQEMKTVYAKVKILEMQLKESAVTEDTSTHKSPNKFLEKFNFKSDVSPQTSESQQHKQDIAFRRKYKLTLDTPRGKTGGLDIVSSILCNRLTSPSQPPYVTPLLQTETEVFKENSQLSAMTITRISLEQETEGIFHYSLSVLKNYLSHLKNLMGKTATNSNSPISLRRRELISDRATVISCLKDLSYIVSCPKFSSAISSMGVQKNILIESRKVPSPIINSENAATTSMSICDKKCESSKKINHPLLKVLFSLANPATYPSEHLSSEEIEWSLSVLVSWSTTDLKSLLEAFDEQIIFCHVNTCHSITASCIVLKLLINICTHKEYIPKLIHNNDSCHLCAICMLLLRKVSVSPLECTSLMLMVEDFLSSVFTFHDFSEIKLETAPCSMMILQAFLSSLWKFYKIRNKCSDIRLILEKGFTLLHYLSKYIPNFKGRRRDCEDLYVSLVCGMLSLSKEDTSFKDFYELAHELWDFQEDTSEFDLEDTCDDAMQTISLLSQNES